MPLPAHPTLYLISSLCLCVRNHIKHKHLKIESESLNICAELPKYWHYPVQTMRMIKGRRQMYGWEYTQPQTSGIAVDLEDFPVVSQHITVSQVYRETVSPPFHFGLQNHETVLIPSDYPIMLTNTQFLARVQPIPSLQLQCYCFRGFKISMHCSGFLLKNSNSSRNTLNGKSALPPQSFFSGSANMEDKSSKTTNSIGDQIFWIVESFVFCFGLLPIWDI